MPLTGQASLPQNGSEGIQSSTDFIKKDEVGMNNYSSPFDHESMPDEPTKGTVLAYQITFLPTRNDGYKGATYDYVSFRAGNGQWYTTGSRRVEMGESWDELWARITRRGELGKVKYATAWAELSPGIHAGPPVTGDDT